MKSNNQIQQFHNEEFGSIRMLEIDGQPWFVGRDVTGILGYKNHNDAVSKHVDAEDKGVAKCDTLGGAQNLGIVNESGLYSLILSSKLPAARRFKRWVTTHVLPSIRKHGAYATSDTLDELLRNPKFAQRLIKKLEQEREKNAALEVENIALEELAAELAPKALYCDMVLQCTNTVPVSVIAKDYGMGAARFNVLLHNLGVQYKTGGAWLLYQKYARKGYTHTYTFCVSDRTTAIHTCWTQKGRLFLYGLLADCGIYPLMETEYTLAS